MDELVSEFGAVRVTRDDAGNGPRLRVEDLKTGQVGYLDPLELETLAWLPEGGLHGLLDPSFLRWREPLRPLDELGFYTLGGQAEQPRALLDEVASGEQL